MRYEGRSAKFRRLRIVGREEEVSGLTVAYRLRLIGFFKGSGNFSELF